MYDNNLFPEDDMQELSEQGEIDSISSTCPALDLEVAIFFDGTGNNLANVEEGNLLRERNGNDYRHDQASYNNDYSNVAKLYRVHTGAKNIVRNSCGGIATLRELSIIDGIGTTSGARDSTMGFALGWGQSGVRARVHQGFRMLKGHILRAKAQGDIKSIKLDVFGFSRGAAAARHFVNCVLRGHSDVTLSSEGSTAEIDRIPESDHALIEIRFLGIFDTVVSWGLIANDRSHDGLMISLDGASIKKIVHITALDEHRENFPLTEAPDEAETIRMPGAHSDIGGGYADFWVERTEIKQTETMIGEVPEHVNKLDPTPIENLLDPADEAFRLQQVSQGWLLPGDREAIRRRYTPTGYRSNDPYIVQWYMERRWLDHRLSRVALHIMHKKAIDAGVALPPLPEDDNHRIDDIVLITLRDELLAGKKFNDADSLVYRRNYVHHSASWETAGGPLLLTPMMPHAGSARRTVYNNDGSVKLN